ncbi:MAG TPA: hypothetical protein VHF28_00765, partial [Nitrososphaera sp.]|nr:hypothetical protein [Nitrososphaera sp.]
CTKGGVGGFETTVILLYGSSCLDTSSARHRCSLESSMLSSTILATQEIMGRILEEFYKKYFEDGTAHSIDTEQAVADAGSPPENYELAYANINYLKGSFLFKAVNL